MPLIRLSSLADASSSSIRREKPTTSAASIAVSRRSNVPLNASQGRSPDAQSTQRRSKQPQCQRAVISLQKYCNINSYEEWPSTFFVYYRILGRRRVDYGGGWNSLTRFVKIQGKDSARGANSQQAVGAATRARRQGESMYYSENPLPQASLRSS